MKSHEFIQAAADLLGSFGDITPQQEQPAQANRAVLTPAEPQQDENPDVNTKSMVGPLQQKLELLKKAVDVENMYDDPDIPGHGNDEVRAHGGSDDLTDMKRLAGIMFNAEEDTDGLEG